MFNRMNYNLDKSDNIFLNIKKIKETAKDPMKCKDYIIPLRYGFRPDLIANDLYNDVSMADYIAILNDIDDSPEGFYSGRKLIVLKEEFIEAI